MAKKIKPKIIIDTREQQPLFTEGVEDKHVIFTRGTLETGDYALADYPDLVVVERKRDGKELYGNLSRQDRRERLYREIDRMQAFKVKYIIIQQSYEEFLNTATWSPIPPKKAVVGMAIVESTLIYLSAAKGINFVFAGRNSGRLVKRILLKSLEYHLRGKL